MFLDFFLMLKSEGLPVSLKEYLALLEGLEEEVTGYTVNEFYYLCRTVLIKHERHLDRFDMLFGHYFKGMDYVPLHDFYDLPEEWLRKNKLLDLSDEEKAMVEAMGGWDKLMERFKELLDEQNERHEGGNKWIGTGGTSPFGANGFNPEGYRIGQSGSRNRSAVKVWDKREFRNFSDQEELNTRNLKMALRRLRVFTREGKAEELDLDTTIDKTCRNAGLLELEMVPSKRNRVKVLLFFDVGGTMDDHVDLCSRLFSAARYEFKQLEFYYFHNCIYETVWKDNARRHERIPTFEVLNKFNKDYKVIIVGDAYMSPYELLYAGGSVEHWNDEAGIVWLRRIKEHYPHIVWLNPNNEYYWQYAESSKILREFFDHRMFPLTVEGLSLAIKALKDAKIDYRSDLGGQG